MDKITSQSFFKAWCDTVNSRKDHLQEIWRKAKEFTSSVKGNDNSIMQEVANKLGLLCHHGEYYCIDTVLYKEEDVVRNKGFFLRHIRVAFEHENDARNIYSEVSHLVITNCDLRVLVTYPNNIEKHLKELHEIIDGNRLSKIISEEESFLIIFGYENGFEWKGYIYKENEWKLLSYNIDTVTNQ